MKGFEPACGAITSFQLIPYKIDIDPFHPSYVTLLHTYIPTTKTALFTSPQLNGCKQSI